MEILLGSRNKGKIAEFKSLLRNLPFQILGLDDFPNLKEVDETGTTFEENAILKATSYAAQTGLCTLADDSGLIVDGLNGEPGIYSARYAGQNSTNEEKIEKVLRGLHGLKNGERSARFFCAMAIADNTGASLKVETGICEGRITAKSQGNKGFGYDPIFQPDGFSATFGELSESTKGQISHRAVSMVKIIQFLRRFSESSLDQSSLRL